MKRMSLQKRIAHLEQHFPPPDPEAAGRLYAALVSLGLPSPAPHPEEGCSDFLKRVPTESLERVLAAQEGNQ